MTAAAEPLLRLERLDAGYRPSRRQSRLIVAAIDANLERGELVCLLGPNGAGKSTLLRTVAGLQPALGGRVLLGEEDLHHLEPRSRARRVAVVLTEPVQVGLMTVELLVGLGRHPHTDWSGRLRELDRERVAAALEMVGAAALAGRAVGELSDGERQKVMIARALVQQPDLLILDEPTAFLDVGRRVEVMALLQRLVEETGLGVLMATHNLDLALASADRLWLLGEGGELEAGGPEDLVLAGSLGRLFAGGAVHFDADAGSFRGQVSRRGTARLTGDGVAALWTRRALERSGFPVAEPQAAVEPIEVVIEPEGWRCRWHGRESRYPTLYELRRWLRTLTGEGTTSDA